MAVKLPEEEKFKFLACSDFTAGLNTLDDPCDIHNGASPYIENMDINKKGKLLSRYGYELVATIPGTTQPMRGSQAYYRTYDDNSAIDNESDINGINTLLYAIPGSISETATNKITFTPSSASKNRIFQIGVWIKGVGDATFGNIWVTLHDASNNLLGQKSILTSGITLNTMNYFQIEYTWTSGPLHFHVWANNFFSECVYGATITDAGSSYTSPPGITITGGAGSGAAAQCTISGGSVNSITITNPGTGYTSPPNMNFSGGGGVNAASTALLGLGATLTATFNDFSAGTYAEVYRTSGDYLVLHCGNGNAYYITATDPTPVLIGSWGDDIGKPMRGTTYLNYAIFGNGDSRQTVHKWDATTLSQLSSDPASIFGVFQKCLFTAGNPDAPSVVNYTDADTLNGLVTNTITFTVGDGWDVSALVPNADALQVFKTDTINAVNFSFDSNYNLTVPQQQPIINTFGGVWATGSAQAIYGYTFYMSKKGFEQYGPNPERVIANRPLPISIEIEPTWKLTNMAYDDAITAAFFDSKYMCAAPLNGAKTATDVFVYSDAIRRRFSKDNWTMYNDIPAAQFCLFRNSSKVDELYFVSSLEPKVFKFNKTFSDNGNGYMKLWTSKIFKFGERTNFYYIDVEGVMTLGATINIVVSTDGLQASDVITKANLITPAVGGAYVGDSYVGGAYPGGGFTGAGVPLYKFKKRFYLPQNINWGYNMFFQIYNSEDAQGWGMNRYVLAYKQDPDDPSYGRTV